ncbi:protein turtle-like isoform X1 [Branchiostoma floridae]|uniref:Protein turtle-like isoform X1 n=2 Tax=Branchiostoma floridae TaxID=7739 RepID=A0A9J7MHB2_BRAFL|nr:protein turtle-like isoform X1 [Branchiostoma floridae]XP_035699399.1 protein turtle-like isoform X1 [Branchiostoma floridae]XP_035699400.1 protein turtle-like isoform X1 [Branchiostoma floridae]
MVFLSPTQGSPLFRVPTNVAIAAVMEVPMVVCVLMAILASSLLSTVAITASPTVSVNISTVVATEGETVVLRAEFSPDYTVFAQTWNKLVGGMRGVRTAVYMYASTTNTSMSLGALKDRANLDSDSSLRIMTARKSDGGLYVLSSVLDVVGQEDHYVQLTILVLPTVRITSKRPVVAMEHSSVILNCTVNHTSSLTSPPYWESDQLQDVSPHFLGNMESDDNYSPWLFLPKVSRERAGNYSCVAEHVMGTTSDSVYVTVLYSAKIVEIVEDNRDSDNVVLQCLAEGSPSPRVAWYRGYSTQPIVTAMGTGTSQRLGLVLSKHHNTTSGQYRCETTNGLSGKDSKSVYVSIFQKAVTVVKAAESTGIIRVQEGSLLQVITFTGIAAASLCLLLVVLLAGFIFCRRRPQLQQQQELEYTLDTPREPEYIPMEHVRNNTSLPVDSNYEPVDEEVTSSSDMLDSPLPTQNGMAYQCRTFYAKVIVPYFSHQPGFLSLDINDYVEVVDQTSSGWVYGSIGDRSGVFPATCVEPINRTDKRRKKRSSFGDRRARETPLLVQLSRKAADDNKLYTGDDKDHHDHCNKQNPSGS